MGRNSVRTSVRTSAHPLFGWSTRPLSKEYEGQLEGSEGKLEGTKGKLEGSEGQPARGGRQTDGWMDQRNFFPSYNISPLGAAALLPSIEPVV